MCRGEPARLWGCNFLPGCISLEDRASGLDFWDGTMPFHECTVRTPFMLDSSKLWSKALSVWLKGGKITRNNLNFEEKAATENILPGQLLWELYLGVKSSSESTLLNNVLKFTLSSTYQLLCPRCLKIMFLPHPSLELLHKVGKIRTYKTRFVLFRSIVCPSEGTALSQAPSGCVRCLWQGRFGTECSDSFQR